MQIELPAKEEYDVLIMGGGWAGLCLARQLKREMPELKAIVLDSATEYKSKVGEATVEITGNYFTRRLGLSSYMYKRHLPKNGLRFWFTDKEAKTPLVDLSEVGSVAIPPHPAFQIDRARMEEDLTEMNRADGIEVCRGVKVRDIKVGENGGIHELEYTTVDNQKGSLRGRWLIDAAGRKQLLGRKLDLHTEEDTQDHCACWGRFENATDIDTLGSDDFKSRVHHTARMLSTNHVAGRGYWIWYIPLSGGTMSVGIVSSRKYMDKPPLKRDEFLAFLKDNRAASDLIGDGQLVDFQALPRLSYRSKQCYSTDRWATVGFASFFLDPYWSLGGDFIAYGNDYITEMIRQDYDPDVSQEKFADTVALYDRTMRGRFDRVRINMNASYETMASYNLFHTRVVYETCIYFLDLVWGYMCDEHMDRKQLEENPLLGAFEELERLYREQADAATAESFKTDMFYANNATGDHESGASYYAPFVFSMGQPGMRSFRMEMMLKVWLFSYLKTTGYRLGMYGFAERTLVQDALDLRWVILNHPVSEASLADILPKLETLLGDRLVQEFPEAAGRLSVSITREAFVGMAESGLSIDTGDLDMDLAKKVMKRGMDLWNEKRPYNLMGAQIHTLYNHWRTHRDDAVKTSEAKVAVSAG